MNPFRRHIPPPPEPPPEPPPPPEPVPPLSPPLFDLGRLFTHSRDANNNDIRQLCHAVTLAPDTVLCRALGRYKMFVDPADLGLSPHLLLDGIWEMWVTEALARSIRGGMSVVDVGANLGYFTLLMADLVGPQGHVRAAEPNPRMLSYLRRSVQVNGFAERVSIHEAPLAAQAGLPVTLQVPAGAPQNASIHWPGDSTSVAHHLITTTLDDLIGDAPVDLVKIDAEGAEFGIWQGMQGLLARQQPLTVVIEFTPDRYTDPAAFLQQMLETGLTLSIIQPDAGIQGTTSDEVLAGPAHIDRMLLLARG